MRTHLRTHLGKRLRTHLRTHLRTLLRTHFEDKKRFRVVLSHNCLRRDG